MVSEYTGEDKVSSFKGWGLNRKENQKEALKNLMITLMIVIPWNHSRSVRKSRTMSHYVHCGISSGRSLPGGRALGILYWAHSMK